MAVGFERDGRLVIQARDEVVHVHLMLQHHDRHNVAMGSDILVRAEKAAELFDISGVIRLFLLLLEGGFADEIPAMRLLAMLAADVPAAPAFLERRPMIY